MRILVFCERLRQPFDEGIKNVAINLLRAFRYEHRAYGLTTFGESIPSEGVRNVPSNRLLLSLNLGRTVRELEPEVVLYIPTASATPAAMLRARILGMYAPMARVAVLALQPRSYGLAARVAIRHLRPWLVFVHSAEMVRSLASLGCRVARLQSGVDASRFVPLSRRERRDLRTRLGLPQDAYIVLHVGHINRNRNVGVLARLQQFGCQVVLVGSVSTEQDEQLADELATTGVIVVRHYVAHVEEYYQAADCYVFPVTSLTGAIEMPLSVLEAMACNLPVVSTAYGNLPAVFPTGNGLTFARTETQLVEKVLAARHISNAATRELVQPFTWEAMARDIVRTIAPTQKQP